MFAPSIRHISLGAIALAGLSFLPQPGTAADLVSGVGETRVMVRHPIHRIDVSRRHSYHRATTVRYVVHERVAQECDLLSIREPRGDEPHSYRMVNICHRPVF